MITRNLNTEEFEELKKILDKHITFNNGLVTVDEPALRPLLAKYRKQYFIK